MALKKAIARMPDLAQYSISTATVHHEQLVLVLHQKTGVVAFRHQRVAGAQHRQFHFVFSRFALLLIPVVPLSADFKSARVDSRKPHACRIQLPPFI